MTSTYSTRSFLLATLFASALAACGDDRVPTGPGENKDATTGPNADASGSGTDASGFPDAAVFPDALQATCDSNPSGCAMGQLKGPAPACMCLGGCEANYTWNGVTCVANTPPDAGFAPDADPAPDALVFDDAATANPDAAPVNDDAATVNADAAPVNADAAPVNADAAPNNPDAAPVNADAAVGGDAGVVGPDSGFVPQGLFEGDQCNWSGANPCLQEPGMICQQLDPSDPNAGLCLKTCNVAQNTAGGTTNAACTGGLGPNCLDIGLTPAGGRCLNAIGQWGELLDVLDVCDNTIPNLRNVGGACWPLCTVTPSPTVPVNLSCSGTYGTCINEFSFNDANNNVFAACGQRVTRGAVCAEARGSFCPANTDLCVLGRCHQLIGNSCTGATCTVAGEVCVEAGAQPTAFCHRACDVFGPTNCPAGDACELTGFGGVAQGSCRSVTGTQQAGDDCSDVLNFGTRATDCAAGLTCVPFGGNGQDEYTAAVCLQFCSSSQPTAPACPAAETCTDFGGAFSDYGICQ